MTSLSETSMLAGSSGVTSGYTIDQSIRFNDDDSPYMERTHGSGGNVDLWTVSFWMKRGNLGIEIGIFGSGANNSNTTDIQFNTSDQLLFWQYIGAYQTRLITTQKFRDPSAWYHVVVIYDSGNVVSSERARMYINGERVTDFGTETYPSQNQDGIAGSNVKIGFGRYISNNNRSFDGYLAEMHYINGYAYGPEYFGEFKEDTDIWIPKEFTGNYGTGGFKVDGRDSSDLGDDESGQGNDLTTSGLAAHDQVLDSPTNNFCVMSSIDFTFNTIKNGNLETIGGSNNKAGRGTMGFTSGKFYWEVLATTVSDGYPGSGVVYDSMSIATSSAYAGGGTDYGGGASHNGANWYKQSTSATAYGSTASSGDILQYALDRDNNKIYWGVNGTYRNSGDPAGGSGAVASSLTHFGGNSNDAWMPFINHGSNAGTSAATFNFGQDGTFGGAKTAQGNSDGNGVGNFYYSPPSGFLALCTLNLGS